MSNTFTNLVEQSKENIETLNPTQVNEAISNDPNTLILDIRDKEDLSITGIIPGSENVSMGTLYFKADHTMPEEFQATCLKDKSRPIITTCTLGLVASVAAKLLKDYGYENVKILEGGNVAWKEAGFATE
jgi:rhodanese-related sulfurtransferase